MTKDELTNFLSSEISTLTLEIESYGDYNDFVENVADGGNHNDTFESGENYGWLHGRKQAYEVVLSILEDTPAVENNTN